MGVRLVVRSTWSSAETDETEYVYEFSQSKIVIGRHQGSDVHIPHPAVSGHHASIRSEGPRLVVVDEGSTNGTKVEGERIPEGRPKPLAETAIIDVGGFRITVTQEPVVTGTSHDKTAALARQIVREALMGESPTESARLRVLNGPGEGTVLEVPPPPARLVLGRGESVDLTLSDEDASREHTAIAVDLDGVELTDLESKNGSFVNDKRVTRRRLKDGDEIRIGKTVVLYEDPTEKQLRQICAAPEEKHELPPEPEPPEAAPGDDGTDEGEAASTADDVVAEGAPSTSPAPTDRASTPRAATAPRKSGGLGADLIIYLLAGAVLLVSVAGLVMLLRSG